MVGVIQLE